MVTVVTSWWGLGVVMKKKLDILSMFSEYFIVDKNKNPINLYSSSSCYQDNIC